MKRPHRLTWRETFPEATAPVALARGAGYTLNGEVHAHDHDFMEIVVVLDGVGVHRTGEGTTGLSRGSLILLRPGAWHAYEACHDLVVVNVVFAGGFLTQELRSVLDSRAARLLAHGRPIRHAQLPDATLARLADLLGRPEPQTLMGWAGLLLLLLDELVAAIPEAATPVHPAVTATLQAIEDEPERNWTLARLARRAEMNPSYLSRIFRAQAGVPPLAYLAQVRAERAATLLIRTDLPCGEVGVRVGWSDPNHFARRFRAHFGASPTAYRERARGRMPR